MGRQSPLAMIRAYHGSPHKFDRFDASKIGTGEGAQAYGHGLYFADREGTAQSYRDALSTDQKFVGDESYDYMNPRHYAAKMRSEPWADDQAAIRHMEGWRDRSSVRPRPNPWTGNLEPAPNFYSQAIEHYLDPALPKLEHRPGGSMYEVGIHADPSSLLDWDKPLSDQSNRVSDIIADLAARNQVGMGNATGARAYGEISQPIRAEDAYSATPMSAYQRSPVTASKQLSDAGIPGIRYLDGGSRGSGSGSSNYVIFNPDIIQILRRYGIAAPAAFSALGQEE